MGVALLAGALVGCIYAPGPPLEVGPGDLRVRAVGVLPGALEAAPLPGVRVALRNSNLRRTTGADGRATLRGLPEGPHILELSYQRPQDAEPLLTVTVKATIRARNGTSRTGVDLGDIVLLPPGSVAGRVEGAQGESVTVGVADTALTTVANEDGSFRLAAPAGESVVVASTTMASATQRVVVPPGATVEVGTLSLSPGTGTLQVTFRALEGELDAAFTVRVFRADGALQTEAMVTGNTATLTLPVGLYRVEAAPAQDVEPLVRHGVAILPNEPTVLEFLVDVREPPAGSSSSSSTSSTSFTSSTSSGGSSSQASSGMGSSSGTMPMLPQLRITASAMAVAGTGLALTVSAQSPAGAEVLLEGTLSFRCQDLLAICPAQTTPANPQASQTVFYIPFTEGNGSVTVSLPGFASATHVFSVGPAPGCGDGITETPLEECDDPAQAGAGGTCTVNCRIPVCGDGLLQQNEACDDGNALPNDGCDERCRNESCDGVAIPLAGTLIQYTVTTLADSGAGSLRAILEDAGNTGAVVSFAAGLAGTITMMAPISVMGDVHVLGPTAGVVILDAGNAHRHFNVAAGATLMLRNLTLFQGFDTVTPGQADPTTHGGGCIHNRGNLFLVDTVLQRCITEDPDSGFGGSMQTGGSAVRVLSGGFLVALRTTWLENEARYRVIPGGALYNQGTASVCDSTFRSNSGFLGGALVNENALWVRRSRLVQNHGNEHGGALYNPTGNAELRHVWMDQNNSKSGAAVSVGGGTVTLDHCTITRSNTSVSPAIQGGGTVVMRASVVALSTGMFEDMGLTGAFTSQGFNVVERSVANLDWLTSDAVGVAPNLTPALMTAGLDADLLPTVLTPNVDQVTDAAGAVDGRGLPFPLGAGGDPGWREVSPSAGAVTLEDSAMELPGDTVVYQLTALVDPLLDGVPDQTGQRTQVWFEVLDSNVPNASVTGRSQRLRFQGNTPVQARALVRTTAPAAAARVVVVTARGQAVGPLLLLP